MNSFIVKTNHLNVILSAFLLYVIIISLSQNTVEGFVSRKKLLFKRCNKYAVSRVLADVFKKNNIVNAYCEEGDKLCNWDIYLPCGYNNIENELLEVKTTNNKQIVFGIEGCDKIVSKNSLWNHIKKRHGRTYAQLFMPNTYVLSDKKDMELFKQNAKRNTLYILKKNSQRQNKLIITGNVDEILSYANHAQYRIVQELLQDPFIIAGRKINIRIYLLIICNKDGTKTAYIHENGFVYYTPKSYEPGSIKNDVNVTSGYIPRVIYKNNPMTLKELKAYLNSSGYSYSTLSKNVFKLFREVVIAIADSICTKKVLSQNTTFQLFGGDVAPNEKLKVHLMELNKGPDMSSKDERDRSVKIKVQEDIFDILEIIKADKPNEFIKIWNN